jgi:hypothetical protein
VCENRFQLLFNGLKPFPSGEEAFERIKNVTFRKESSKEQFDDCSLIYIQKK